MNTIVYVGEHSQTYEVQWHAHDYWELVYCTGGDGVFRFENGTVMNYKEGEVVAIPPAEVHNNTSSGGFTNIHLRVAEPSFPYRGAFRVADYDGHLLTAFTQCKFFFLADMKMKELVLNALGELISSYMVVYRSNAGFSEPVEMIRSAIMRNYEKADFALDQAIRELPFHYDYLRKLFKKEVGITPLEYMTNLRMKKAEIMLTSMWNNGYSVSEIAGHCGYDDALYFSRVFKKTFGCSPSVFAKERTKEGPNKENV